MPPYATEFTNEMDQGYLASLLNPIDEAEQQRVGQAKAQATARGLEGQLAGQGLVGLAQNEADQARSSTVSKFNFDVAGMKRDERLTQEKESFTADQAQKDRDEKEKLANMGYEFSSKTREAQNNADKDQFWQTLPAGIAAGAVSAGVGGYFGGLGKAAAE